MRLVSRRIVSSEEAALVCGGRQFHAYAATTGNDIHTLLLAKPMGYLPSCKASPLLGQY